MNDRLVPLTLVLLLGCAACGDDTGGAGGSGAGGGDSSGSGTDCPDLSDGPGGEACGDATCSPTQYCDEVETCQNGCQATNTCPEGEWCDLSTAGPGEAGTCRPAPSECSDDPTTTSTSSGGAPADCQERCVTKLLDCGFAEQVDSPEATCSDACQILSDDTLECLEAASCAALSDGEECGVPFGD
jgi:hypothetical protein